MAIVTLPTARVSATIFDPTNVPSRGRVDCRPEAPGLVILPGGDTGVIPAVVSRPLGRDGSFVADLPTVPAGVKWRLTFAVAGANYPPPEYLIQVFPGQTYSLSSMQEILRTTTDDLVRGESAYETGIRLGLIPTTKTELQWLTELNAAGTGGGGSGVADGAVTNAKVAVAAGISLDKTADSGTRVAVTPAQRTAITTLSAAPLARTDGAAFTGAVTVPAATVSNQAAQYGQITTIAQAQAAAEITAARADGRIPLTGGSGGGGSGVTLAPDPDRPDSILIIGVVA